jgi:hypothetical protein
LWGNVEGHNGWYKKINFGKTISCRSAAGTSKDTYRYIYKEFLGRDEPRTPQRAVKDCGSKSRKSSIYNSGVAPTKNRN